MKTSIIIKSLLAAAASSLLAALNVSATGITILPPESLPYGLSYQEWAAKWWQWSLSQATNKIEYGGLPDICDGPASEVRFLAGGPYPTAAVRHITISDRVALFFPVLSVWVDNTGCPTFTDLTADQLLAEAEGMWGSVTETSCTLDGELVAGMEDPTNSIYLVQSPPFSYTTAPKHNVLAGVYGAPCIGGNVTVYPAVADGIFLMLAPLKPGKHTIHFVGIVGPASAPYVDVDVTYDITCVRE